MSTRDDIHKLRQSLDCACKNNEANLVVLDNIENALKQLNLTTLYANWNTQVGNSITYTYYTGVAPGNPSGNTSNVETAEFYEGAVLMLTQTFTYDVNNNCTSITTT
jgi:hypothetical protein